ncbi:hypothetical protein ACFFU8_08870 [Chromobacterium piscinae]|uniref:hypothetical protein n=1 Tax=Chromobacterium piscinae TaxID=686831 RepID=UPI001E30CE39|nr:hypothetical protein [Chromobacterium piscinae]MCD5327984.1 hypothetical protein [Chromobacterium piscinae]
MSDTDEELSPNSGLVKAIERLIGHPLTSDQVQYWQRLQDMHGVSDDDPIVMIFVLLGVHQHLFNDVPKRIQEATDKAIAIHRTTLEDQSNIVAKRLLEQLTPMFIKAVNESRRNGDINGVTPSGNTMLFANDWWKPAGLCFLASLAGAVAVKLL